MMAEMPDALGLGGERGNFASLLAALVSGVLLL